MLGAMYWGNLALTISISSPVKNRSKFVGSSWYEGLFLSGACILFLRGLLLPVLLQELLQVLFRSSRKKELLAQNCIVAVQLLDGLLPKFARIRAPSNWAKMQWIECADLLGNRPSPSL